MTRSLLLAAAMGLAVIGGNVVYAHDIPTGSSCGCSTSELGHVSAFNSPPYTSNSSGCVDGSCPAFDARQDRLIPSYGRSDASRWQTTNPSAPPSHYDSGTDFDRSLRTLPRDAPFISRSRSNFDAEFPLPYQAERLTIPRGMEGIALLPIAEQRVALLQRTCPVTQQLLGSMGRPVRVNVASGSMYVCCESCVNSMKGNSDKYLSVSAPNARSSPAVREDFTNFLRSSNQRGSALVIPDEMKGIALLPVSEQQEALRQRICPVTKQPLGSMGKPIRVNVAGRSLFVCCEGCVNTVKQNPNNYLR